MSNVLSAAQWETLIVRWIQEPLNLYQRRACAPLASLIVKLISVDQEAKPREPAPVTLKVLGAVVTHTIEWSAASAEAAFQEALRQRRVRRVRAALAAEVESRCDFVRLDYGFLCEQISRAEASSAFRGRFQLAGKRAA